MKRITLFGIACFALYGCGNDSDGQKVTEEMLLGEWNCKVSSQEAESRNGKLQDFGDPEFEENKYIFTKKDGQLFISLSLYKEDLMPLNLEDIYKRPEYTEYDRQRTQKIKYLSKDSFSLNGTYTIIDKNNKPTSKFKEEYVCDRIKE